MSSPISPLTDRINRLRQLGSQAVDAMSHPGQTLGHMFSSPSPEVQHQQSHQQAIDQMNKQAMDKAVQDANASHVAAQQPNLSTMKKPLGK
jgi:hypothetical protein